MFIYYGQYFIPLLHFLYTFVTISLIKSLKTVKLIINLQRTTVLFMHIYNRSHSLENTTCSIAFVILLRMFWQLYLCKPVIDRHQPLFFCFSGYNSNPVQIKCIGMFIFFVGNNYNHYV